MCVILLLTIITVDQQKIDKAMEIVRPYYNELIAPQYPIEYGVYLSGVSQYLSGFEIEFERDDIIIGDQPAETLYISGYFYHSGNIIVMNDGVLIIKNADFNLDGDISVVDQGTAMTDSSAFNIIQHYIYQHIIFVNDSASFSIMNSQTSFYGHQININVQGAGEFVMDNVENNDWITAVIHQNATVFLDNVDYTGEWLFIDNCYAQFKHVDYFISWYFFPDSAVVDMAFPDGDTVYGFYIDSTLSNVNGIGYHVEIDSSTNCLWATIPLRGSDVTINDSELRVTGIMFEGVDTFTVSGLVNGLLYDDYVLPVPDRNYHLINTSVQTWNLYPSDTVSVELSNSIFGELGGYESSNSVIQNAFCDGSGGHIEANSNATVIIFLSSIFADVITKDRGICFIAHCAMPWGNIWATGSSVLIFVNTQFPEEPIPSDTAIVFVAAVNAPSIASVEDTVGIVGSAWIDTGPYNPLDFDFYRLFYRVLGESAWILVGDENYVEVRYDTLDYWNTVGLAPDIYEVRLVLKNSAGDSIEALKQIRLQPTGVGEEITTYADNDDIKVMYLGSRVFYIETNNTNPKICIYDILGRQIQKFDVPEIYWTAPASGIFFLRDKKTNITKKIVVY